jgi:predicted phage terminase large subunit-like protein
LNPKTQILNNITIELARRELAKRSLYHFIEFLNPNYHFSNFHKNFIKIVDAFAQSKITKLIVTIPPQHGKSLVATKYLSAFALGQDPDCPLAIGSYNQTYARKLSRDTKRIISDPKYKLIFPKTIVPPYQSDYSNTMDEMEIPKHEGSLRVVGRGGPLTGNPVKIMSLDDLYKDYAEAMSPVIRATVIDWYESVIRTRLYNESKQLITFTRWHEDDLIGYLEKEEGPFVNIKSFSDLENADLDKWYKINFQAIKMDKPCEIDPREKGDPLWPERHSLKKLKKDRALDPGKFQSLHQGDPKPSEGLLYTGFGTYEEIPASASLVRFYADTADQGADWTYVIVYSVCPEGVIYIRDIYCSDKSAEITEREAATTLYKNNVNMGRVESNAGGRGWARAVERILRDELLYKNFNMEWFHQSGNKEARIISNAGNVQKFVLFPKNWKNLYPIAYNHLMSFRKNFKANVHDDAPDCLVGVYESSTIGQLKIRRV